MPLRCEILEEPGLVLTLAEGEVGADDLLAYARELAGRPDRPLKELCDFSERAEITVPMETVREMAIHLRDHDVNPPGARLALVAKNEAIFGTLRMYAAYRAHDALEIGVFRDRAEALEWLGVVLR